jgi:hypothetical protein
MTLQLKKAERKKAKIRLGLSGASGFGKTYSALLIAKGLVGEWEKIALIDTENGSGELYSDLGDYNVISLESPYSPERYIESIKMCEDAGIECIIVDSITHEWDGKGGCLDIQNQLGGRYQDWAKVTPRHDAFIQSILTSKAHVITTVRRKQDYEMTNENGKTKVQKVGTKEVTREGFEYELTMNLEFLNDKHMVKASKDRTSLFMGQPEFIPSIETGETIKKWCESGAELPEPTKEQFDGLVTYLKGNDKQKEAAKQALKKYKPNTEQLKQLDGLL